MTAVVIPVLESVAGSVLNYFSGDLTNQQRQSRCSFVEVATQQGSVVAAQYLMGGLQDTASNEQPYYQTAINAVEAGGQGSWGYGAWIAAQSLGPLWSTSDTAASYPEMSTAINNDLITDGLPPLTVPVAGQSATTSPRPATSASRPAAAAGAASATSSNVALYVVGGLIFIVVLAIIFRK